MEAAPQSPKADSKLSPRESKTDVQASKRRKLMEKTVLKVKIEANVGNNQKTHEGPPSDFWSWRKYGQKPIKGSPYPRGYYRCSTSKGCSAKKQVERCRTDASMLVITYTSSHNHPGPDLHAAAAQEREEQSEQQQPTSPKSQSTEEEEQEEDQPPAVVFTTNSCATDLHQQGLAAAAGEVQSVHEDHFNYLQSPIQDLIHLQEADNHPLTVVALEEKTHHDSLNLLFDEEPPLSYPHLMTFSSSTTTPKSEEYDFYDELEELPTSSSLTSSFMRSTFFDERILVFPS